MSQHHCAILVGWGLMTPAWICIHTECGTAWHHWQYGKMWWMENSEAFRTAAILSGIWVKSCRCGCLITWFCYQLIAKPGNKTATPPTSVARPICDFVWADSAVFIGSVNKYVYKLNVVTSLLAIGSHYLLLALWWQLHTTWVTVAQLYPAGT